MVTIWRSIRVAELSNVQTSLSSVIVCNYFIINHTINSSSCVVWATPKPALWISSAKGTILNHLAVCIHQPAAVRQMANTARLTPAWAPSRTLYNIELPPAVQPNTLPPPLPSSSLGPTPAYLSGMDVSSPAPIQCTFSLPANLHLAAPNPHNSTWSMVGSVGSILGPPASPLDSPSFAYALAPCDFTPSQSPTPSHFTSLKRPRTGMMQLSNSPIPYTSWSEHRQTRLENGLAQLTASANLPLRWIENPELQAIFAEFFPSARLISQKQLTNVIVPRVLGEQRIGAQRFTRGQESTVQGDGWSGGGHRHWQGFVLAV